MNEILLKKKEQLQLEIGKALMLSYNLDYEAWGRKPYSRSKHQEVLEEFLQQSQKIEKMTKAFNRLAKSSEK